MRGQRTGEGQAEAAADCGITAWVAGQRGALASRLNGRVGCYGAKGKAVRRGHTHLQQHQPSGPMHLREL